MRSIHDGLTISAVVPPKHLDGLRHTLRELDARGGGGPDLNFAAVPSLLFCSMVIAEAATAADGTPLPYRLLIFTSYTGPRRGHLEELIRHGADGWHRLFAHCEDYPGAAAPPEPESVGRYLRRRIIRNTYYTGSHFVTRTDREREHALRAAIQNYLDERWQDPAFAAADPQSVRRDIQAFVAAQPELRWAAAPYRLDRRDWWALYGSLVIVGLIMLGSLVLPALSGLLHGPSTLAWVGLGIGVVLYALLRLSRKPATPPAMETKEDGGKRTWLTGVLLPVLTMSLTAMVWNAFAPFHALPWAGLPFWGFVLLVIGSLSFLRRAERIPTASVSPVDDERMRAITSKELHPVVNEMSVISVLKPGRIRRFFLGLTLRLVPLIRAFNYIPTVHSARWLQTDGGRRLVFIAYFDNTSEGYAHDFVDSTKRTRNLNLIFGHALGFPPTRYAVLDGGKDRRQYMLGVRRSQLLTGLWYNSRPELSITNVTNNRAIRKGLFGKMDRAGVEEWLALL